MDEQTRNEMYEEALAFLRGDGVEMDEPRAAAMFKILAEDGDAKGMNRYGKCFLNGWGVEEDPEEALDWFVKASDLGEAEAMQNIGYCYFNGEGVDEDFEQALYWYQKALDNGLEDALFDVGVSYKKLGKYEKAFEYFMAGAKKDDPDCQRQVGTAYFEGRGVERDLSEAIFWIERAKENGDEDSDFNLGLCYQEIEEYEKAFQHFMLAAEDGDAAAQCEVGMAYYRGEGVEQDYDQAVLWLKKATEQDDPQGWYVLGVCYLDGKGTAQDYRKASDCLYRAAEMGNEGAMRVIVQNYEDVWKTPATGENLPADADQESKAAWDAIDDDPEYAVEVLTDLASKGHKPSRNWLVSYYYSVAKDNELMCYWLLQQAELGDSSAISLMSTHYQRGIGVEEDEEKGFRWLQDLCRRHPDYMEARTQLALCFLDGTGVEQDREKGLAILRKAAEDGHPYAQDRLGYASFYLLRDANQAEYWLRQAISKGYKPAEKHLSEIQAKQQQMRPGMSPGETQAQQKEMQRIARLRQLLIREQELENEAEELSGLFSIKRRLEIQAEMRKIKQEMAALEKR